MIDIPVLETEHLRLRAHHLDDFEAYAALWREPTVIRFIGGVPLTREAVWVRFLRASGLWNHLGFGFFLLEDKATGALVGEAGFHDLRRDLVPSIEGTMETGWVLAPAFHGRGLAEEAMRAALSWAGAHGVGDRLTCIIHPDHGASLRVAQKLGFTETARSHYHDAPVVILDRPRV